MSKMPLMLRKNTQNILVVSAQDKNN